MEVNGQELIMNFDREEFQKIVSSIRSISRNNTGTYDSTDSTNSSDLNTDRGYLLSYMESVIFKGEQEDKLAFLFTYPSLDAGFDPIDKCLQIYRSLDRRSKKVIERKKVKRYNSKKTKLLNFINTVYKCDNVNINSKHERLNELFKIAEREKGTHDLKMSLDNYRILKLLNKSIRKIDTFEIRSESKIDDITTVEPMRIALELTREAGIVFCQITPHEILATCHDKSFEKIRNVGYFIKQFQKIAYWIPTEVLKRKKKSEQLKLIRYFVDLGTCLKELGNYHFLMALIAGLGNISIKRISHLWQDKACNYKFSFLEVFMSSFENYKTYRDQLDESLGKTAIIPYLGLTLKDLRHIYENMPNFHESATQEKVNSNKLSCLYYIINKLVKMQVPYEISQDIVIQHYLNSLEIWEDDNFLYQESCKILPRRGHTQKNISRRVSFRPFSKRSSRKLSSGSN